MKGTQENKGSILVEQLADNKQFSSGFNSSGGVNYSEVLNSTFRRLN
jgi:hypothetical protein